MTVKEEIDSMLVSLVDNVDREPEPEVKIEEQPKEEIKEESNEIRGDRDKSETTADVSEGENKERIQTLSEDGRGVSQSAGDTISDMGHGVIEPKVEEPKVIESDGRDQIIADLQSRLAAKEAKKEEPKIEDQDFLGEVDLDELTRDPKEFNKVLNKIYQKAVMDTRSSVVETLPEIVKTNIAIMNELKSTSDRFYEDNKDLQPFRKVVSVVFDELASASPTKNYSDLIKEVAPEVRKRLNITKKVEVKEVKKSDPPKLPQKGSKSGKSQDSPNIEPLQAELEEMTKTLRR